MQETEIGNLIQKHVRGQCTSDEIALLETWYTKWNSDKSLNLTDDELAQDLLVNRKKTLNAVLGIEKVIKLWPHIVAAASIVICIGFGFYFYQKDHNIPAEITAKNDIAPGGNKAFLTLADGKRITLTDAKNGELAEQSGVKITKTADGQLIYTVSNPSNGNNYNTIETPRGGTYQVCLPDGTKVWLNAASTLRFPSSFARLVNRRVELLSGEAYFEVAKDKKHPFIVQTSKQDVKVLGTHFNITNYADESSIKTTLIEGSVSVNNRIILKPGEQAINEKNNITIRSVDIGTAVDWKNNDFVFKGNSFRSIMRKIARWYDVEIVYDPSAPEDIELWGMVSRKGNISTILKRIESTSKVHFKIEGRRITVTE